jgi:alkylresorcinol/alkylpyrone synthase
MTTIAGVQVALPVHRYTQAEITETFTELCAPAGVSPEAVRRLHGAAHVQTRHLALPLSRYAKLRDFTDANEAFLEAAVELGSQAVLAALAEAGLKPADVDLLMSTTVTGLAVPTLDARIAARLGMRADVKRLPLFGLGCVAGAAGIARLHDFLRGTPRGVGVLVAIELCSLTLQQEDPSIANLVASGLFGDGAAAVVALGPEWDSPGPRVVDSLAHLYPDTERVMGWDIGSNGLKIVLSADVPALVQAFLRADVEDLLARHGLAIPDVARWVSHPGGPRVIEAIEDALDLTRHHLALTWDSLRRIGNVSSASVLHVLRETLDRRPPAPRDLGVLMALGPGFCSELVLLQW